MAVGQNPAPFTSNRPLVCQGRQQERGSLATAPIDWWIDAERSLYRAGTRQSILTQIYAYPASASVSANFSCITAHIYLKLLADGHSHHHSVVHAICRGLGAP